MARHHPRQLWASQATSHNATQFGHLTKELRLTADRTHGLKHEGHQLQPDLRGARLPDVAPPAGPEPDRWVRLVGPDSQTQSPLSEKEGMKALM